MPNAEELARYVSSISEQLVEQERKKGAGYLVPPLPKPGEIIICQHCGKPMYPKDFSTDPVIRKQEFKWHLHQKCRLELLSLVDRETPGLLAERTEGISNGRPIMQLRNSKNQY